jgi:glucose-6-phosphate 1-dehydrogenase
VPCPATIERPEGLFLAIEKPFGTDAASAHDFNQLLARVVPEEHVFRIDHYRARRRC